MSPPAAEGGRPPHVALLPSAGMGHLIPFLRLAAALAARGCQVTLVTPHPAVSAAEARHLADFLAAASSPRVRQLDFRILPFDASSASTDPFILQFEAIRRSAHLLGPLLSSASPALSAVVTDIPLTSAVVPVAAAAGLPNYVFFISSAAMLALCAAFPSAAASHDGAADTIEVPRVAALPIGWIPAPLRDPANLFTTQFVENGRALARVDGILINTWEALEGDTLAALNAGAVAPHLPHAVAVGPLPPVKLNSSPCLLWLDDQPERSVVYVSFGSRTALSAEQMRELGIGLEKSGCRFLWVVKSKKVDKEDEAVALEDLLDDGYLRRVEGRGLVVKDWVDQDAVLAHRAVGGFVSHCGWSSVTEAALRGVRLLAWPRGGDQRVNAWVVERGGLGTWAREWSWEGDGEVVGAEEISQRVGELLGSPGEGAAAARVWEEAVRAAAAGGSSCKELGELIANWSSAPERTHSFTSPPPPDWQG